MLVGRSGARLCQQRQNVSKFSILWRQRRRPHDEGQAMLDALNAQYDDIISWADMYDSASMESKKMIVSCLIRRVEVYRDYRLHIDFNIDFEQFSAGLDISAIAA